MKYFILLIIVILFTGCGHCHLKTALYLTNSNKNFWQERSKWPALGTMSETINYYNEKDLYYRWYSKGQFTLKNIYYWLHNGYRVVAVYPTLGTVLYHAIPITDVKQCYHLNIVEIHIVKI